MKKLIGFGAVALCAAVSFGDVTSANVVGFQNKEAKTGGWNLICNTFLGVGKEKSAMTLGDFVPNASWDCMGGDAVQFLKPSGATETIEYEQETLPAMFTYFNEEWATVWGAPAVGWYQSDKAINEMVFISGADRPFEFGNALVVEVQNEGTALVFSGEVLKGPQNLAPVSGGWNVMGNATPVDTTLGNLTPNENWDCMGGDAVQFLKPSGATDTIEYEQETLPAMFTYFNEEWATVWGAPAVGWYQSDKAINEMVFISGADRPLAAGDGFVVEVQSDTVEIQLPAAIAE